jgi:crossover junction endodeoxyribonuclease RuvC
VFVLGVDPGLSRCGYAVLEPTGRQRSRPVALGVIRTPSSADVPLRLAELQRELRDLFNEYSPAVLAIERIFAQHNVRTVIGVAQASGLAMAEAASRRVPVVQYSPSAVKSVVTGDGRADKSQVQAMVRLLLDLPDAPRPADAADAAALALCHLAHDPHLTGRGAVAATGGGRRW